MKAKGKTNLVLIGLILIASLFVLYSVRSKTNDDLTNVLLTPDTNERSEVDIESSSSVTASAVASAVDENHYINTKYKFSLDMTDDWKGYSATYNTDIPDWIQAKIEFSINSAENKKYIPMIIYVARASDYDESLATTIHATKINQNSEYVYLYTTWEETPPESISLTDKSIANTIKTLELQ